MSKDTPPTQPERVEGEITQDEQGNVVIGAPTATGFGEAPPPGGEESD